MNTRNTTPSRSRSVASIFGTSDYAFSRAAQQAGLPVRRLTVDRRFSLSLIGELRRHLKQRPGSILHTVGYKAHLHAVLASRGVAASVTTTRSP